jgi:SAM-dependent methyltransferase
VTTHTTMDWTELAPAWGRLRGPVESMKTELSARLLDALALMPGETVLELGAGTGEFALTLAERTQPTGRVIASDLASGMVELIETTVAGRDGLEAVRLDASAIDLPDRCVDAVVFRMGLMLIDDPATALAEIRRVARPGGRVAVAVWAGPEHNPWMTSVGMSAMMQGLVSGPPVGPGSPFSLADPTRLEQLCREAGFADVSVEPVDTVSRFATAEEHLDTVRALSPLGGVLAAATPDQLAAVRGSVASLTAQYRDGDELAIPGRALLCVAR